MELSDVMRALEHPWVAFGLQTHSAFHLVQPLRHDSQCKPSPGEHGETERNSGSLTVMNPTNTDAANMAYCRAPCQMEKADECRSADDER